jgi:hypothetical protein
MLSGRELETRSLEKQNLGRIVSVRGSVVDVHSPERLPGINNELRTGEDGNLVVKVASRLLGPRICRPKRCCPANQECETKRTSAKPVAHLNSATQPFAEGGLMGTRCWAINADAVTAMPDPFCLRLYWADHDNFSGVITVIGTANFKPDLFS